MNTSPFGYAPESPVTGQAVTLNKVSSRRKASLSIVAAGLALGLLSSLHAATVTWDGGGADGTWGTGTNWSGDAAPGSSDNASFGDVTTGTRTVNIDSATAIKQLTIRQITADSSTVLNVNADLTLTGSGASYAPFAITPTAGQGSIVTNIGAGVTLKAVGNAAYTSDFDGTLNMAKDSVFLLESTSAFKANFGGPINVTGAGAKVVFDSPGYVANGPFFNGAITVSGVGSTFKIEKLANDVGHTAMYLTFTGDDGLGNSINLGAGTRMDIVDLDWTNIPFTNRVKMGVDAKFFIGSVSSIKTGKGTNIDFNGGLVMDTGAQTTVSLGDIKGLTLDGISSWEAGSELLLQYRAVKGIAQLMQSGTLTMDGAALNFDYVSTTGEDLSITRNYQNTGTWTMQNGASVAFISSEGNSTFGSKVGSYNNNTGTFSLESGSTMGFRSYYNGGTMNLGSSTGGVSNATVILGSPDNTFTEIYLANGGVTDGISATQTAAVATLNINGDAWLGRNMDASGTLSLDNGSATSTGSVINVGDGAVDTIFTTANRHVVINNYAGNTINLNAHATLQLMSLADNTVTPTTGNVSLTNDGTLVHTGDLMLQGAYNGTRTITTSATGVYRVNGADAFLAALPATSGDDPDNVSAIGFTVNGQLSGASATDALTYANFTANAALDTLLIKVSGGELTPGLGSNSSGTSSVGSLEFVDTSITLSNGATMTFDIGGSVGSGLFDSVTLSGDGAAFDLGSDNTLDIRLVNGATSIGETYRIVTSSSVTGTFGTLLFNGVANNDDYTVNYLSNGVEISSSLIPEPAAMGLIVGGLALLAVTGRRRHRIGATPSIA